MILEVRSVGRKTPLDGKLEITGPSARRLTILGTSLPIVVSGEEAVAHVESMKCSCQKGGVDSGASHVHYFLRCELFRQLVAEQTVALELTERGTLEISLPHPI